MMQPHRTRDVGHGGRVVARLLLCCALAGVAAIGLGTGPASRPALAADTQATARDGVGRIVFRWEQPVRYTVEIQGGALVARFDAPVPADVALMPARLPAYVESVRVSGDRRQVVMPLKGDFGLRVFTLGSGVVVDLEGGPPLEEPAPQPAPAPDAAPAPAPTESGPVRVRTGEHDGFTVTPTTCSASKTTV